MCCVGRETRFGLTSCVPLRIGNVGTRASLTFVRRAGGESPLLVADWIVLHSITCVPLRLHSGAVSRFSCALDFGRFPMRLDFGALTALLYAVGFGCAHSISFDLGTLSPLRLDLGALSGAKVLTCFPSACRTVAGEQDVSSHPVSFLLV